MPALTASDILALWERGAASDMAMRGALLLAATGEVGLPDQCARLPLGQRDARLLALRERLFGPQLASLANCPACAERVELQFNVADVRVSPGAQSDAALTVQAGEYETAFRLPTSADLQQLDASAELAANRRRLFELCIVSAHRGGKEVPASALPDEIAQAVATRMAEADPQADVQLAVCCPNCGHQWEAPFDIVSFLWTEIHAWAMRMLREIHVLASAYGWHEADILALSPSRRQAYLELIQS